LSGFGEFVRSIRFRLSILYSSVVFGLGAAILGVTYYFIRRSLRRLPLTAESVFYVLNGRPVVVQEWELDRVRAMEQLFAQVALDRLADYVLIGLVVLFLLSLVVGWIIAGRALRPVTAITAVARDIQASDLSRRIDYRGPDDELGRLAATFDDMLGRLDAAFHAQRRFLADTSHDLRTPLAVIRSNIDVLAEDPDATVEEWREVGDVVQRNAERMASMIDDLLAAARLEARAAARVGIDLAELVTEAATELAPRGAERDVTVEASPLPARIEGVPQSLRRAIANLADNALRAAPPGTRIVLASGASGDWAWVAVADEGEGIDPEVIEKPARRGLGLSIVHQIVEAHGGRLAAHRGAETGTTMVMWLPCGEEDEDPPPGESPLRAV
jgi:signal transduction histidine kinase